MTTTNPLRSLFGAEPMRDFNGMPTRNGPKAVIVPPKANLALVATEMNNEMSY